MAMTEAAVTTQVYQVYIKANPEAIWDAITEPEWMARYGYQAPVEFDVRPGGAYRALATEAMRAHGAPEVVVDGEVVEADPPRRLVRTWRPLWDRRWSPRLHASHLGDRGRPAGRVEADGGQSSRARRRSQPSSRARTRRRRRLGLDSQRPQVAARDRRDPQRLT